MVSSEELDERLAKIELQLSRVNSIILEERISDLESRFEKITQEVSEDRISEIEAQIQKVKPIVKTNTKIAQKLNRNLRAIFICILFFIIMFFLSLDNITVSKSGEVNVTLGDVKIEAIYAGIVAISFILDKDIFRGKIMPIVLDFITPHVKK